MSKTLVSIISMNDENREWNSQVFFVVFIICVHVYGLLHYQLHEYGVSSFYLIIPFLKEGVGFMNSVYISDL